MIRTRSQDKTTQSQSYKFEKKNAKNTNFAIVREKLHGTHLLKLLDKMYKYEMDPTRTVGTTEWTQLLKLLDKMYKYEMDPTGTVGATERTQDTGRMDRVKPIYPTLPNNFVVQGYT